MSWKETVFEIGSHISARLSGKKSGRNAVLIGSLAGDRLVQPTRTLVVARHKILNQASGTPVEAISSLLKEIGISDVLELKDYEIEIYPRFITGSDMVDTDAVVILVTGGSVEFSFRFNPAGTTVVGGAQWNGIRFQLNADMEGLSGDAFNWGATETHSYGVFWKIYRLTDGIGQFSL